MKHFILSILFIILLNGLARSQSRMINGMVISATDKMPLKGAGVLLKMDGQKVSTDAQGHFTITLPAASDTLIISYVGYNPMQVPISSASNRQITIQLVQKTAVLEEVTVSTGYYQIPKERATGSFAYIDNELINRSTGNNILSRLEGIAPSLQFDRRHITGESSRSPSLRIRGLSTIESNDQPLIILDNFPYENDLNSINPNDVESVTLLRDAAAASIWGARAGNGVIVITTKQGRYNQRSKIGFNSNVTILNRPNLFYNQNYLPAATVMGFEKELFNQGFYDEQPETVLPAYVEQLIAHRDGKITGNELETKVAKMENQDIRKEALNHLYQRGISQQYALNLNGGGSNYRYYASVAYDKNKTFIKGDQNDRINLNIQNTFQVFKKLEITGGIWYAGQRSESNGITLSDLSPSAGTRVSPYLQLRDENRNASLIPYQIRMAYADQAIQSGLLDWNYRPLDELSLNDNKGSGNELRMTAALKYSLFEGLSAALNYQHIQNRSRNESYHDPNSWQARDLINTYTQKDGTKIIPNGGIMEKSGDAVSLTHSGRFQLNYQKTFQKHEITALAGTEIRQQISTSKPGFTLYGYDKNTLIGNRQFNYLTYYPIRPGGSLRIPSGSNLLGELTDRYLSYFGNVAYTYLDRYTFSGSWRWDGSNLFGVKTNQKGVPLWSAGGSWQIGKESFYNVNWLPYLRMRATYGSSGNVNKQITSFPVTSFVENINGLPAGIIISAGNPGLRWERVNTFNLGLDFASKGSRIQGSIDYYVKKASDLIGQNYLAPSTGIIDEVTPAINNLINYANMQTKGFDLQFSSKNLNGKLNWETTLLLSYSKNKITNYSSREAAGLSNYFAAPAPPRVGTSRDALYWLPWAGLDHSTGVPLVNQNGSLTSDYQQYIENFNPTDLLQGLSVPPYFGSLRNTFSFKNVQVSAMVSFKTGYVFRKRSMYSGEEYLEIPNYNMDYFKRWKQPGDELKTNVPSAAAFNIYQAQVYGSSAAVIAQGDHIRLQDISLSYIFNGNLVKALKIQNIRLYGYARDLGLIWQKDKSGIDPEYPNAAYPAPASFAIGVQANF